MSVDTQVLHVVGEKPHGRYHVRAEVVSYNQGDPMLSIGRYERLLNANDEVEYQFRGRPAFDWELLHWLEEARIIEKAIHVLDEQ